MGPDAEVEHAEVALLGAAIASGGRGLDDLDFDPADFNAPVVEHAWRTILAMVRDGKPVDQVTLWAEVNNSAIRVDPTLLHRAVEAAPTAASIGHYAGIVSESGARRRLTLAATAIADLARQPGDVDALIEEARRKLDDYGKVTRSEPVSFAWETMQGTVNRFNETVTFTPTPWGPLNEIIGGLRPGALYTVGARPGVGKSVVGVQLGLELARHGGVAMMSLEMSQDDVNKRILSHQTHVPMERLTTPRNLTADDRHRIGEWLQGNRQPFAVHKSAQVSITDVRRFARNVHRRAPLAGIVVDYLQLMAQAPHDRRARHEFVADMSRGLKLLALDMNVPVVMLSQLNRLSTTREDKRPALSDLRESGAIEQDSDVVILLHRDTVDPANSASIDFMVAKNRHGRPGVCTLDFAGHYSEIR